MLKKIGTGASRSGRGLPTCVPKEKKIREIVWELCRFSCFCSLFLLKMENRNKETLTVLVDHFFCMKK